MIFHRTFCLRTSFGLTSQRKKETLFNKVSINFAEKVIILTFHMKLCSRTSFQLISPRKKIYWPLTGFYLRIIFGLISPRKKCTDFSREVKSQNQF